VYLRPGTEVDEQPEEVRRCRLAAGRVREGVHDGQHPARRERLVDLAEEADDLVGRQVMDEVEAEHAVVPAAQIIGGRVPFAVLDPGPVRPGSRRAPSPF
jgi:hypothetical protein